MMLLLEFLLRLRYTSDGHETAAPCDSVSFKPFWSISSPPTPHPPPPTPEGVSYLFPPSFYRLAGVHLCFPLKGQLITGKGYHKSRLTKVSLGLSNITLNKHGPLTVRWSTPYCGFCPLLLLVIVQYVSLQLHFVNIYL